MSSAMSGVIFVSAPSDHMAYNNSGMGSLGLFFLPVHGSVMGVVGVMVDVSMVQSSATSGAVFMSACGRVAYKNSGVGSASP